MTARNPRAGASATALGEHLDLTKQRVGQLADEGVLPRLADGSFDLDVCRIAYIRWQRRPTASPAEERLKAARAEAVELRTERESGALVSEAVREATATFDVLAGGLRSDLLAVPAQVTNDLALRRKIEVAIDNAFRTAAERAAKADASRGADVAPSRQARRAEARRAAR